MEYSALQRSTPDDHLLHGQPSFLSFRWQRPPYCSSEKSVRVGRRLFVLSHILRFYHHALRQPGDVPSRGSAVQMDQELDLQQPGSAL